MAGKPIVLSVVFIVLLSSSRPDLESYFNYAMIGSFNPVLIFSLLQFFVGGAKQPVFCTCLLH
jgi:hypothetical protein